MPEFSKPKYNSWAELKNRSPTNPDNYVNKMEGVAAARYPQKDLQSMANAMHNDLEDSGANPGEPIISVASPAEITLGGKKAPPGNMIAGKFNPNSGVTLNEDILKSPELPGILFHEMNHAAATNIYGQAGEKSPGDPNHFAEGISEPDLAQSLQAQKNIEEGAMIDPQVYNNMPWLKGVRPGSSNYLANPWEYQRKKLGL